MKVEVRPARHEDVARVASWTTDTFEWGDYVPDRLPTWIDDPRSMPVVCQASDGDIIGVANTVRLSPAEVWLEGARVHPAHKRAGVGTAMNRAGLDWARRAGARVARLATEADNTAARRQVETMGYRHTSTWAVASLDPSAHAPAAEETEMRVAPSADVDAAWLSWAPGELARAGQELLADGWRWRRARPEDLGSAAGRGELLQWPSGWAIVAHPEPERLRVGWASTSPEVAPAMFEGLLSLARSRQADRLEVKLPWLPWVRESLIRSSGDPREVTIYTFSL